MAFARKRMSSFVDRGNEMIAKGKTEKAMELIERGLQHYSEKVIGAISPFAKADAGLIVLVLRHLADKVEMDNKGAKELAEGLKSCVVPPELTEMEKIKKPNRR